MTSAPLLPLRLARWWPIISKAAAHHGVDALTMAAIMDRESHGGEMLVPKGPSGTGDWAPRRGKMPADGLGWGRGLWQIDIAAHPGFCALELANATPAWADPERATDYACGILAKAILFFDGDETKAIAAYNAGVLNVRRACAELTAPSTPEAILAACDECTTGHDYVSWVFARRKEFTPPEVS